MITNSLTLALHWTVVLLGEALTVNRLSNCIPGLFSHHFFHPRPDSLAEQPPHPLPYSDRRFRSDCQLVRKPAPCRPGGRARQVGQRPGSGASPGAQPVGRRCGGQVERREGLPGPCLTAAEALGAWKVRSRPLRSYRCLKSQGKRAVLLAATVWGHAGLGWLQVESPPSTLIRSGKIQRGHMPQNRPVGGRRRQMRIYGSFFPTKPSA